MWRNRTGLTAIIVSHISRFDKLMITLCHVDRFPEDKIIMEICLLNRESRGKVIPIFTRIDLGLLSVISGKELRGPIATLLPLWSHVG